MASESWFGSRSRKKTKAPRIPKDLAVKDKTAASALSRFFKKAPREYKLLLLGAGESGKTTILKQIQLIHGNGFDQNVREEHREYIQQNVLEGMITLIKAQSIVGIEVSSEESKNAARYIVEYHQSMQAQRKGRKALAVLTSEFCLSLFIQLLNSLRSSQKPSTCSGWIRMCKRFFTQDRNSTCTSASINLPIHSKTILHGEGLGGFHVTWIFSSAE